MLETRLPSKEIVENAVKEQLSLFLQLGHSGGRFDVEIEGIMFTVKVHNRKAKLAILKDESLTWRPFYQLS